MENLRCEGPIFILSVTFIFPPKPRGLLLFPITFFSTAVLLNFRAATMTFTLRSHDPQYLILTILLIARWAFLFYHPGFTPGCSTSTFNFKHLKSAHYLLSLSHPNLHFLKYFQFPQDSKISFKLDSFLV